MKDPECDCFREYRADAENTVYNLSASIAAAVESSCIINGLCPKAFPYVAMTVMTMLARGMAGEKSGDVLKCDSEFEEILQTIAEDVRHRDEILNAMIEKRGRKDQ